MFLFINTFSPAEIARCCQIWDIVSEKLKDSAHNVTSDACRKKYSYLLSRFKETRDHNSRTGKCLCLNPTWDCSLRIFAQTQQVVIPWLSNTRRNLRQSGIPCYYTDILSRDVTIHRIIDASTIIFLPMQNRVLLSGNTVIVTGIAQPLIATENALQFRKYGYQA